MIRPATVRQREYVSALIIKDVTADEASRLIGDLRRDRIQTKDLLEAIIDANRLGKSKRLGSLLVELRARTMHGQWLPTLRELQINPRRAQRLVKAARE